MQTTTLPGTNLAVSTLCFGTADWGTGVPEDRAEELLTDYLDAGGSFLDTAHVYAFWKPGGLGASERTVGRLLERLGARGRVVVATKGGHPDNGPDYPRPADFLSASVLAADVAESLERLGVDTIDLYYLHRDDGRTPAGEIIERLNEHIRAGRVRYLGASNWSVARTSEANEYAARRGLQGFVASQVQWSLAVPQWTPTLDPTTRFVDEETAAFHGRTGDNAEHYTGLPVVAYSATASGYFAGKGKAYETPENALRRGRANEVARQIGATPTQVAVAWLLHQPFPVFPAFSTSSREHLREILGAASLALTPEQVAFLRGGNA